MYSTFGQSKSTLKIKDHMDAYLAFCDPSKVVLKEHLAGEWITVNQVHDFDWAPADVPLLDDVIRYFQTE